MTQISEILQCIEKGLEEKLLFQRSINGRNLNFRIQIFFGTFVREDGTEFGCDTVENINNGFQNSVFIHNIGSRLLGHIVCINSILLYRNPKKPSKRRMPQIAHFIWDLFENLSVAKRLNNASSHRLCLSTFLSL